MKVTETRRYSMEPGMLIIIGMILVPGVLAFVMGQAALK
jgi:hypothetical protein